MFHRYTEEHLGDVKCDAKQSHHIVQYDNIPIFEEILSYCKSNNLLLSNIKSMVTPPDKMKGPGAYNSDVLKEYMMNVNPMTSFVVYGSYIFKHANDLANLLAKNHTPFVELFTTIPNRIFNMKIKGMARVILFIDIKKNNMSMVNAVNGKWLPPNLELINIYRKLYSPEYYGDRDELNEYESKCWEIGRAHV